MYIAASGSRLAQSVLMALQHEGKPSYLSNEAYLKRFARTGWDKEETDQAYKVMEMWGQENTNDEEDDLAELQNFPQQYTDWLEQAASLQAQMDALNQQIGRITTRIASGEATTFQFQELEKLTALMAMQRQELATVNDNLAGAVDQYRNLAEQVFGYEVEFAEGVEFSDEQSIAQIQNLATSNLEIIRYFDEVLQEAGSTMTGLEAFNRFMAYTPSGTRITVHLGDNVESQGEFVGNTPLPGSAPDEKLDDLYLGSQVSAATITHEFFHQLDRYFNMALSSDSNPRGFINYLSNVPNSISGAHDLSMTRQFVIVSGASPLDLREEIFADLGMTAVLDGLGLFINPDPLPGVDPRLVAFTEDRNAQDIECALRQYFRQLLTGEPWSYESCQAS
jgi:hypothetical protein